MASEQDLATILEYEKSCMNALMAWINSAHKNQVVLDMLKWRRDQAHEIALEAMREAIGGRCEGPDVFSY
jgi:hypothetical protein